MATGQAKKDLILRSAPTAGENATTKSEAELIGHIQQAFAEKNSTLLVLERQQQEQTQALCEVRSEALSLLTELHRTQELLEQVSNDHSAAARQVLQQATRIKKLKSLLPDRWEMEISAIKKIRKGPTEILCWSFVEVYFGDDYLPHLNLETHLHGSEVGVCIKDAVTADNKKWFRTTEASAKNELYIFPEDGPVNEGGNTELTSLGTSDWAKVKEVVRHLARLLTDPDFTHPTLKKADITGLRIGLDKLDKKLTEWPWVFRFDHVELNDTLQTYEYQRLSFRIYNLSVGNFAWGRLDYSVATVDHSGGFGQNPRLEFPESSKQVISNWYPETSDGRGPRLELRFAKPNEFDWNVWRKLTHEDQLLIAALVSSLPAQIHAIEKQNTQMQDWQKWHKLCRVIKAILASQLKSVRA